MNNQFLTGSDLPFCKGCGHTGISELTAKALDNLGLSPLDVILVTDIGCHGIIDKFFLTHTVHGLHGRSVALASGIAAAMHHSTKKIIVFIGDGGTTIGMQHLIDAAHRGLNMTVVVHNNMLYGMTGGQPSELTPSTFSTPVRQANPGAYEHYDLCSLMVAAGANYVSRITGIGDYSDKLAEAFSRKGFSLVEVMEICPSYGVKANPGMKLSKVIEEAGLEVKVFADKDDRQFHARKGEDSKPLISEEQHITKTYDNHLKEAVRIMLCGSAGEGVQLAAELFAKAAIRAGLHVSKKGTYPVTVGIGFSVSEIILSPDDIYYTGSPEPDFMIITSVDGMQFGKARALKNRNTNVMTDQSLEVLGHDERFAVYDFRNTIGSKSASLVALITLLREQKLFDVNAFMEVISETMGAKINLEKLK